MSMKINITEKQIKRLTKLMEQTPDTEESLGTEILVVNYKNRASGNWRHFFNDISGVTPEDIKNEDEIISMYNEIIDEIKRIELSKKIASLEDKVALNLDEKLYSELLTLRNQLKGG